MNSYGLKRKIYDAFFSDEPSSFGKAVNYIIFGLLILSTISAIIDSFKVSIEVKAILNVLEIITVVIFSVEFVLRIYIADLAYPDMKPTMARLKYLFSFMALIDLLAILPFYLPVLLPADLRALRMLRLFRLFRLMKLTRYTSALSTIWGVVKTRASALLSSLFIVSILLVISSILMYNIENAAQPDKFDNVLSGFWWAIATLTTVGYGDIYPVTSLGKILSSVIAILGIGFVALPTGILSAGFIEVMATKREDHQQISEYTYCPHCGKKNK